MKKILLIFCLIVITASCMGQWSHLRGRAIFDDSTRYDEDANFTSTIRTVNLFMGLTTQATAGGSTTLTSASTFYQVFTGTLNQTVYLPVTSTLKLGAQYYFYNNSTGIVTVVSSGGNTICTMLAGTRAEFTCVLLTGTTAASWTYWYGGYNIANGKKLNISNTMTFVGTDGTTMTFPTTSATIARTDAGQTFTGHNTFEGVTATGATGTGNMVFSATPTFTGTLGAANISATGGIQGKGEFNIIQYGAISNDGNSDAAAIQAAINAAYAYNTGSTATQGKVIIPAGEWDITVPDTLKSYVHVIAEPGSRFQFAVGYTNPMWVNPSDTSLIHCILEGGHYRMPSSYASNWLDFRDNDYGPVEFNVIKDVYVAYADNVINLNGVSGTSFNNSNLFSNMTSDYFMCFANLKGSGGNQFTNLNLQTFDLVADTIFSLQTAGSNSISNCIVWDYGEDPDDVLLYIDAASTNNNINYHADGLETVIGRYNSVINDAISMNYNTNVMDVHDDDAAFGSFNYYRHKDGTPTLDVDDNTTLGKMKWWGWITDQYYEGANITVAIDDTPGANDMGSRMEFYTSADGSATPTKRFSIDDAGIVASYGIFTAPNTLWGYTAPATAGGTTTLTAASNYIQRFTGTLTQTVLMPVTTTLQLGWRYLIFNQSTQNVTIQTSAGNTIVILPPETNVYLTCRGTGTSAANWLFEYYGTDVTSGKTLSVSNSLTLAGTDATTMTFPTTSATIARTDAANTFTGNQTVNGTLILGANDITMTGSLASTGSRVTKGWFTDIDVTNDVDIADVAISGSIIKKTIGWHGAASVDFLLPDIASHGDYPIDLGAIVPAKSRVKSVEIVCTEAATAAGAIDITMGAGNATGGAQFIVALSCDDLNEVVGIIDPHLPAAVVMNWAAATNIWILANPDVNYDTMTAGKWAVYVTYEYYGAL
jgi:hypothetical protein